MDYGEDVEAVRRHRPARRISIVAGVLFLLVALQVIVLMIRVSQRTTISRPQPLAVLLSTGGPLVLVLLAGAILLRGRQRSAHLFNSGLASLGLVFLATANWLSSTWCGHSDPPRDYSIPQVRLWGPHDSIFGVRVPLPELGVISADGGCYVTVNAGIVGLGFLLLSGSVWLSSLPDRILDSLSNVRR